MCQLEWSTTDTSQQFDILILYVTQSLRRVLPNWLLGVLLAYQWRGIWSIWLELLGEDSTGTSSTLYTPTHLIIMLLFLSLIVCCPCCVRMRVELFNVKIYQCQDNFNSWTYFICITQRTLTQNWFQTVMHNFFNSIQNWFQRIIYATPPICDMEVPVLTASLLVTYY